MVIWLFGQFRWSSCNKLALFSDLSEPSPLGRCLSRRLLLAWRGRRRYRDRNGRWLCNYGDNINVQRGTMLTVTSTSRPHKKGKKVWQ